MIWMHLLRMMNDLAFYYCFAAWLSVYLGGHLPLAELLVQAFVYAFFCGKDSAKKRYVPAAFLFLIAVFLEPSAADRVFFLPPALYIIWILKENRTELSWEKTSEQFILFLKSYPVFFLILCVFGQAGRLLSVSFPEALVFTVSGVLLMRSLRHEPKIYCSREYQLQNLLSVGLMLAASWLSSTKMMLTLMKMAAEGCYRYLISPFLYLCLWILGYLVMGIVKGIEWILSMVGYNAQMPDTDIFMGIKESLYETEEIAQTGENLFLKYIFFGFFIAALGTGTFLFFRFLAAKRGEEHFFGEKTSDVCTGNSETEKKRTGFFSPESVIRRHYRKFLRYYVKQGGNLRKSDTSGDVLKYAETVFEEKAAAAELREIYLKARYDGTASGKDAEEAEKLLKKIIQTSKHPDQ